MGYILQLQVTSEHLFLKAIGSITFNSATAIGCSYILKNNLLFIPSKRQAQLF